MRPRLALLLLLAALPLLTPAALRAHRSGVCPTRPIRPRGELRDERGWDLSTYLAFGSLVDWRGRVDDRIPGFHDLDGHESGERFVVDIGHPNSFAARLVTRDAFPVQVTLKRLDEEGATAVATYFLGPRATRSRLTLRFAAGQRFARLRLCVERANDGTTTISLPPTGIATGASAEDAIPPTQTATAEPTDDGMAIVTLDASDTGGTPDAAGPAAGVAGTWYAVEGEPGFSRYRLPLLLAQDGYLLVFSVDRAGNDADTEYSVRDLLAHAR